MKKTCLQPRAEMLPSNLLTSDSGLNPSSIASLDQFLMLMLIRPSSGCCHYEHLAQTRVHSIGKIVRDAAGSECPFPAYQSDMRPC